MIFVHRENHHHKSNAFFFQKQIKTFAIDNYLLIAKFTVAIKPFRCYIGSIRPKNGLIKPNCLNFATSFRGWKTGASNNGDISTFFTVPSLNVHFSIYSPLYSTSFTWIYIFSSSFVFCKFKHKSFIMQLSQYYHFSNTIFLYFLENAN